MKLRLRATGCHLSHGITPATQQVNIPRLNPSQKSVKITAGGTSFTKDRHQIQGPRQSLFCCTWSPGCSSWLEVGPITVQSVFDGRHWRWWLMMWDRIFIAGTLTADMGLLERSSMCWPVHRLVSQCAMSQLLLPRPILPWFDKVK